MSDTNTGSMRRPVADLQAVALMAASLERLETGGRVDPAQYRLLVERLSEQLRGIAGNPRLFAVLRRFPAAAELYENLNYEAAGLCLRDLDAAAGAETRARSLLSSIAARR